MPQECTGKAVHELYAFLLKQGTYSGSTASFAWHRRHDRDSGTEPLCKSFIFKSYVSQAVQELRSCAKDAKTLLSQREMPQRGWSEVMLIKGYRGELSTGGHCPRSRLERAR